MLHSHVPSISLTLVGYPMPPHHTMPSSHHITYLAPHCPLCPDQRHAHNPANPSFQPSPHRMPYLLRRLIRLHKHLAELADAVHAAHLVDE